MAANSLHRLAGDLCRTCSATRLADYPDAELLARFRRDRDPAAFEALVRRHGPLVLAACRKVLPDPADVDDAFQATFLVLLSNPAAVRSAPSLGSWLYGVAHRTARSRERRDRVHRKAVRSVEAGPPDLSWREAVAVLHEELDALPERYRLPLRHCYLEGLTRDEAAARLGWRVDVLRGRLERGREKLRGRLTRRGVTLSAGLLAAVAARSDAALTPTLVDGTVAAAGEPSPAVAALARGVAVTGLLSRTKLAAVVLGVALAGTAAVPFAAEPTPAEADQPAAKPGDRPGEAVKPRLESPVRPTAVGGTVLGPDGKPAAGVSVFVQHYADGTRRPDRNTVYTKVATTAADGAFLGDVPEDTPPHFWVVAVKPGFGVAWAEPKYPDRTLANADRLALRLVTDQPITGRVVDTQGKPVTGVAIGVFTVIEPLDGDMDKLLRASANGGFGSVGQWEKVLHPPAELARATTGADGEFELAGMGADRVVGLTVSGKGLARMSGLVVTRAGVDVGPLNTLPRTSMRKQKGQHPVFHPPAPTFVVEPGYAAEGVITHKGTGKPIPGCRLELNTGFWDRITTATDADGKYRFDGLTKGMRHHVHVTPPAGEAVFPTWADVTEPAGFETAKLDLALVKGAVFAGRAVDKETRQPVPASFQIIPTGDNEFAKRPEYETASRDMVWKSGGADGRFRIVTVPGPSTVNVNVEPTGTLHGRPFRPYRPGQKLSIDLKPDGNPEFTVEVERGGMAGVTVVDADGDPAAGLATAGQTLRDHGFVTAVETFRLPPQESTFTVYGLGEADRRRVVAVQPDGRLGGSAEVTSGAKGELKLLPLQPVRGTFTDADGTPLAGLTVTIDYNLYGLGELFRDHAPNWAMTATTDKDGQFEIPDVIPGLPFTFGVQRGDTKYRGTPRLGTRTVPAGRPLDLGTRKLEIAD